MYSFDGRSSSPSVADAEPLLLKLPEEVLERILLDVVEADQDFLDTYVPKSWENTGMLLLVLRSKASD